MNLDTDSNYQTIELLPEYRGGAAPYFATSGSTTSSRSSSPVTELTSALPWYTDKPDSSAATIEADANLLAGGTKYSFCHSRLLLIHS